MSSYDIVIFHFMNTHPPTHPSNISKVSLSHYTYTLDGSWGGWWMVLGWLEGSWGGWWWGGWMEGSWGGCVCGCVGGGGVDGWKAHRVDAYTQPPMKLQY